MPQHLFLVAVAEWHIHQVGANPTPYQANFRLNEVIVNLRLLTRLLA